MTLNIPHLAGKYVQIGRTQTWYTEQQAAGTGPLAVNTIVGLNGLAGGGDSFWTLLAELRPGWRAIMPDLPGGGKSGLLPTRHDLQGYVAWLDQFLARFSPNRPVVLQTVATGAAIALEYALLYPQRVAGLCLHLPMFDGSAFHPLARRLVAGLVQRDVVQRLADHYRHDQQFMLKLIAHEPPQAIYETAMRDIQHKQEASLRAVGEFLSAVMLNRARPKLLRVRSPMLMLATAHDFAAPVGWLQEVAAMYPQERTLEVEEGGHAWNEEYVGKMVGLVQRFLAELNG